MALVICLVEFTDVILLRISFSPAMSYFSFLLFALLELRIST